MLVLNPYPQTPSPWEGAILLGLPPLVQARMLVVSHTKPLHDAVAQMADDLYGGSAPATPFLSTKEVFRQSESCGETYISSQLSVCRKSLLFNVLLLYLLVFIYDSKLPIVLFVGQHFSGSLFESMHLSILTRERTKETRARDLTAPLPIS